MARGEVSDVIVVGEGRKMERNEGMVPSHDRDSDPSHSLAMAHFGTSFLLSSLVLS